MAALAITRWTLVRTLRDPLSWGLLALSALAWPALLTLSPLGITTASSDGNALVYEVAFGALLLGAWRGMSGIENVHSTLSLADPRTRLLAQFLTLWSTALLWGVIASLYPMVRSTVGEGGVVGLPLGLLFGILLGAGHLALLATLLLQLQLPKGARSLALILLAWGTPALLSFDSLLATWVSALLDVAATLRPSSEGWSPTALAARIGPMMSLAVLAALLGTGRKSATHQLPDPSTASRPAKR